jgi:type IV pilus assembly protein PilX
MQHSNQSQPLSRISTSQSGVVLIVALIMLLVMTIAGVTTMSGSTLQERMASNQRQRTVALTNADQSLRQAETTLNALHGPQSFNATQLQAAFAPLNDGLYTEVSINGEALDRLLFDRLDDTLWNNANSVRVLDVNNTLIGRYIIQYMGRGAPNSGGSLDFGESTSYQNRDRSPGTSSGDRDSFRITAIGIVGNNTIVTIVESYYLEEAQF